MFLPEWCKNCVYITLKLFFKFSREQVPYYRENVNNPGFLSHVFGRARVCCLFTVWETTGLYPIVFVDARCRSFGGVSLIPHFFKKKDQKTKDESASNPKSYSISVFQLLYIALLS